MKAKGSKEAHFPKPAFMDKPQTHGKNGDKALRELVALGYIRRHPTAGGDTYQLSDRGFYVCKKLRDQRKTL
jgi:hypothetical protein